ncbi:unnamed protein product [Larinioides sclopetarius]|uniref:Fibrinogen C-terminal domain-containing protein n=1 Tax=Larinioides sclopetarius TaxID=280406 RepID=A0AAV1ZGL7_9ARAC
MLKFLKNGVFLLILLSASHLSQANELYKEEIAKGILILANSCISKSIAHLQNCDVEGFKTNDSEGFDRETTLRYLVISQNYIKDFNRTIFPICDNSKLYDKPADCSEVLANGNTQNGLYSIWPRSRLANGKPVMVYCDMETDGGGWTVIQRRGNFSSQQNFYQDWEQYKTGFGDKEKDFWLGNDYIHALTNQAENEIRFDLQDANGERGFAKYSEFWIDNEDSSYALHIRNYTGNVGDTMKHHNNMKFSTKDKGSTQFARFYEGGWWYNDWAHSNLNGRFQPGRDSIENIHWWYWRQNKGLAGVEIKVRPR